MKKSVFTIAVLTLGIIVGHFSSLAHALTVCRLDTGGLSAAAVLDDFDNKVIVNLYGSMKVTSVENTSKIITINFER